MSKTRGIYVCVFSTGVVKVGRGAAVESRITCHKASARCFGVVMESSTIFTCGDIESAERELIAWCAKNSSQITSKEWFSGIDIEACLVVAADIAVRFFDRPVGKDRKILARLIDGFDARVMTREHLAYIDARKKTMDGGMLTEQSFVWMDMLHDICEDIRKMQRISPVAVPEWFDVLNCIEAWEIDLMFDEGLPSVSLVENINTAFVAIKSGSFL